MTRVVDLGFRRTKVVHDAGRFHFPAMVCDFQPVRYSANQDFLQSMILEYDGQQYFVGPMAERQGIPRSTMVADERFTGPEGMVLMMAALLATAPGDQLHRPQLLATLPVSDYDRLKTDYQKALSGTHVVQLLHPDGKLAKNYCIEISNPWVMPQCYCVLFHLLLDDCGAVQDPIYSTGDIGIIDLGSHTVGLARSSQLDFIQRESKSYSDIGLFQVFSDLSTRIRDKYGIEVVPEKIDPVLTSGFIKVNGKHEDARELIRASVEQVAKSIISRAKNLWQSAGNMDRVVITGGGAKVLGQFVAAGFHSEQSLIRNKGILDNAEGGYKFMKWVA